MRDLTTLFVEASLAKGEWLAALRTLQLSNAASNVSTPVHLDAQTGVTSHLHTIARTLAAKGNWAAAISTLRSPLSHSVSPSSPSSPSPLHTYSAAYLAERVQAYHEVAVSYHENAIESARHQEWNASKTPRSNAADEGGTNGAAMVLRDVLAFAEEAFHVSPPTPRQAGGGETQVPFDAAAGPTAEVQRLLKWCEEQLDSPSSTAAPLLSAKEKIEVMRNIEKAAQAALRGVTHARTAPETTSEPSDTLPSASPSSPSSLQSPSDLQKRTNDENNETGRAVADGSPSPSSLTSPLPPQTASKEGELETFLHRPRFSHGDWAVALRLLTHTPAADFTPRLFTALVRLLTQQGRAGELDRLVRAYLLAAESVLHAEKTFVSNKSFSDAVTSSANSDAQHRSSTPESTSEVVSPLAADAVVLKTVAESCRRLQCATLAADLLQRPSLRAHLTPSAAVPLVMVLRDAQQYGVVMQWWQDLLDGEQTLHYPLLKHAKLSSYVASCVLYHARAAQSGTSGRIRRDVTETQSVHAGWQDALRVFAVAERSAAAPELVLLFQLRLLRQAQQWEAALQLFSQFCEKYPNAGRAKPRQQQQQRRRFPAPSSGRRPAPRLDPLDGVFTILTAERVEHWVPEKALRELKQQVSQYRTTGRKDAHTQPAKGVKTD